MPYPLLIAGAGPAGCAAAYDLAQADRRVLLLDRRSFPRPKACACGLTRKTLAALRYTVAPIIERECREIVLQRADDGETHTSLPLASKSAELRVRSRRPIAAMAVRERFDEFCLAQTLAAGRHGGSVTLVKVDALTALRDDPLQPFLELDALITEAGTQHNQTFCGAALIGADGSNGMTRRLHYNGAEPAWYTRGFALEATVPYTALPAALPQGDAPHDLVFDFAPLPGGYGWLFPKGNHINIGVGSFAEGSEAELKRVTRPLLATYTRQKLGVALAALPAGAVTGQHLGMGGHAYVPHGRVLLAGDAAGLVDPLTGEGIHSALISGQAAAAAILRPTPTLAAAYARELAPLQSTLAFSARAARAFYREPARGFRAMAHPLLRPLILKTYTDGLPATRLLTAIGKLL